MARLPDEAGMVTAETALVLPLVAGFTLAMAFLVSLGVDEVRLVDAARDAARSIAVSGDVDAGERRALDSAPATATVHVTRHDGLVDVTVTSVIETPRWLLVPLPAVTLSAHAAVQDEASGG